MSEWEDVVKETKKIKGKEKLFTPMDKLIKNRALKIAIYGDFSAGKSFFSLTSPEPVFCIDTEDGLIPLINNFKNKNIQLVKLDEMDKDKSERDGVLNHEKLKQIILYIINLPEKERPKTIVFDSVSDLYDMIQDYIKVDYHNLKPEQKFAYQFDWGQVNNVYKHILQKLVNMNINLILTAKAAQVYDNKGQIIIGKYNPKWQRLTPYMVDVVIFNKKVYNAKTKTTNFSSTIEKCRMNKDLIGQSFVNLTYDKLIEIINKK